MKLEWDLLVHPIAHNVRALVRQGLSNAQFLERKLDEPAAERMPHIRSIIESQINLNQLFVRLVTLADAQKPPRDPSAGGETLTLEAAILAAKLQCQEILKEAGADVTIGPAPECRVAPKVQIAIVELLDNAVRFRDPSRGPRIVVDSQTNDDRIQIRVCDNGLGVDSGYTDKLFEPFQRLDATRSGFGLGLAIARTIVEASGGTIRYETAHPGSSFVIELPYRE
jgi:signal transduction histidine kinase